MRHKSVAKKFGRSSAHREQLMRMLVANLILAESITTTLPKAREARKVAERAVTMARKGTLAARRLCAARLRSVEAVKKLFDEIVPAMEGRQGGYTRITKLGARKGDAAELVVLSWVAKKAPEPVVEAPAEVPAPEAK
ncbi:MAG: 50S ribosomal protein L17 [Kiritimatiellia bacterium]|nr:50S ribosomal protein L17 [Kiritimatiellia bacterium]